MKTRFIKRKPVVALLALGIFVGVMYTDFYMKKQRAAEKRKEYLSKAYEQQAYNWIKEYYLLKGSLPKSLEDFTNSNISLPDFDFQLKNMKVGFKTAFQKALKSKPSWQQDRQRDLDILSKHEGDLKQQLLEMLKPEFNLIVGVPFLEALQKKYNLSEDVLGNFLKVKAANQQQREATAEKAIKKILDHVSNVTKDTD